ncbi:hypothetical protein RIF23_02590 [Lipingzhangella sp. LS1_29]|uniref:Peptidase C39-like domain-containing protein n=1 Tax=Lipingzhangella rawalii TaxID=2055835 RepID=A0ABU2H2X9_9ACTN|nr:hypothetical protein [Lipingzhangella rawalii]MDS1269180.1 hypothetical protein [Lipingzhangella rawalii]
MRTADDLFLPSRHGLGFVNSWPRQPAVRLATPVGRVGIGNAGNGLCGGMVFVAADYFHVRWPAPCTRPGRDDALYGYIVRRIVDSWCSAPGVLGYYRWMLLNDAQAAVRTIRGQWPSIANLLIRGVPVPLGLVTVAGAAPAQLRHNHQVLAYAYTEQNTSTVVRVYDPNRGPRDDVAITIRTDPPAILGHNLGITRGVRGFFQVDYTPRSPPG